MYGYGSEPRAPYVPTEADRRWSIYREHYCVYEDEYAPRDSWKGERILLFGTHSYRHDWSLIQTIYILGKRGKNGKLRAFRWSTNFVMADFYWGFFYDEPKLSGKCKSVADARRQASAIDVEPYIQEVLKAVYSLERATCVYRRVRVPTDIGECYEWEPWATVFGYPQPNSWPYEHYFEVGRWPSREIWRSVVDRTFNGYSASWNPGLPKLPGWFPDEPDSGSPDHTERQDVRADGGPRGVVVGGEVPGLQHQVNGSGKQ